MAEAQAAAVAGLVSHSMKDAKILHQICTKIISEVDTCELLIVVDAEYDRA
jgi:hypothetical protein